MKLAKATLALGVIALLIGVSGAALAGGHGHGHGHGHVRFGVYVGGPAFWPGYYYGAPYYPYPPYYAPVPYPAGPAYYIEQGSAQPAPAPAPAPSQAQANWWYHCADARAYYPYVRECPGGWQRVAPQPLN